MGEKARDMWGGGGAAGGLDLDYEVDTSKVYVRPEIGREYDAVLRWQGLNAERRELTLDVLWYGEGVEGCVRDYVALTPAAAWRLAEIARALRLGGKMRARALLKAIHAAHENGRLSDRPVRVRFKIERFEGRDYVRVDRYEPRDEKGAADAGDQSEVSL